MSISPRDQAIWEGLCANDKRQLEKATEQLTKMVKPIASRFVMGNSGNRIDVDDLIQDTVMAVWKQSRAGRYVPQPNVPMAAFIQKVVRNLWLKELRQRKWEVSEELPDEAFDEPEDDSHIEALRMAFRQLGEKCQRVLTLFYWENLKMEEVATRINSTTDAVKMSVHRCRKELGAKIQALRSETTRPPAAADNDNLN